MKVLIVSADRFEDSELLVPYYRLREEGVEVDIASLARGKITGKHGYEVEANLAIGEVNPEQYAALVLPGGKAPVALCGSMAALDLARAFMQAGKPVAAICHGPQVLATAGVLGGRAATCYPTVAAELRSAGARYTDAEVVVDGNLVTSRRPADLPAFMREFMKRLRALSQSSRR